MKTNITLSLEVELLKHIEELRGREKRSTFIEHILKLGLKEYLGEKKLG